MAESFPALRPGSPGYTRDAWGRRWYAQATPPLADAGSRWAAAAGLWHYTTRPDQVKEGATPVDLGLHHVAAEPAEAEITVSGAALSASSSYYNGQWNPPNARNGLWTDPGWHNSGYTQPVEFLRADLGASRPVGGVAYVPRGMSASWTDGTWNGVYRRWEIYVADSASSEPADWGVPVAAGEWSWPNGQERREVRFSAKSGRYVIWRRVEAWGWSTRQAGQSWPGYANANEVGVYPPPPPALSPVDTDSDGLADWVEDANGDGTRQPGETDFAAADSDYDGCSDAEERRAGTDPVNPDSFLPKRLAYWRFNGVNWLVGEEGQQPLVQQGVTSVPGFDGAAVRLQGAGTLLKYRCVEADGRPNLNLARGAVRVWFKPDWVLANIPDSARLLFVGAPPGDWWGIYWRNLGDDPTLDPVRLRLGSRVNNVGPWYHFDMPINEPCMYPNPADSWTSNPTRWHEIILTWSPISTWRIDRLCLDGAWMVDTRPDFNDGVRVPCDDPTSYFVFGGPGIPSGSVPGAAVQAGGFVIGHDQTGGNPLQGAVDELEFFNYPIGLAEQRRRNPRGEFVRVMHYVSGTVNATPAPSVTIHRIDEPWPDPNNPEQRAPLDPVSLWRRAEGEQAFTQIIPETAAAAILDSGVVTNRVYEYALGVPYHQGLRNITAGINLMPRHQRGRVILLVEDKLLLPGPNDLRPEIEQLRADLVGDGWQVSPPLSAPRHDDGSGRDNYTLVNQARREQVEAIIAANDEPGVPNVVFILGHVIIPYSGITASDGHRYYPDCHGGPWVCDGYYGSLDKTQWTDTVNCPKATHCDWAVPDDGCFDQDWLPPLDYAVGRIDFARLPALIGADYLPPEVDTEAELEVALLRQYLAKNHRYRMGLVPIGPRVASWEGNNAYSVAEEKAARAAGPLFGLEYGVLFTGMIYKQPVPCAMAFMYSYGKPDRQYVGGEDWFPASDLKWKANEPPVLFYNLEASWFPDWNCAPDNLMRALLATPTYGLACTAWGDRGVDRLALGGTWGDAMLHWIWPLRAFASVLGDPTLRIVQLPPVRSLSGHRQGGTVTLRWVPAPEVGTTYFVYRSSSGLDGFGAPLNALPTADTLYADPGAPAGALYMVRPSRLVTTGAGSYFDLGQGAFVAVP